MLRFNDIADRALEVDPECDLELLQRAYVFSAKVHEGQERVSGEPYLIHPLEVDVQGALQLRERRRDARFIFLLPPSLAELERRLRGRGTDAPDVVERRLAEVRRELAAVHAFDYAVVNEDVERTIAALHEIVAAERSGETGAVRARHGRAAVLSRVAAVLPIPSQAGPARLG